MNDGMLTVSNSEFGKLDILVEDGKELFPANDAAKILGYSVPHGAIQKHCRGCLKRTVTDSLGRTTEKNFITVLLSALVCLPRRSLRSGCLTRFCPNCAAPAATAQSLPPICRTSGWDAGVSALMMLQRCLA